MKHLNDTSGENKGHLIIPYQPPYDSMIEKMFAWPLAKYLSCTATPIKQYEVKTLCGVFRLDFVVISDSGYKVGYECDGRDYHDESRDEWRDAAILGDGLLDAIIRLRGTDIVCRLDDAMYIVSQCDPKMFSDRGRLALRKLATPEAKTFDPEQQPYRPFVIYREEHEEQWSKHEKLAIKRRCQTDINGLNQYWRKFYNYAKEQGGGQLDSIIAAYEAKRKIAEADPDYDPFADE